MFLFNIDYTLVNHISGAVDLGTHIIMGDPSFVNAANGDFYLGSNSPAMNEQEIYLGAYEFQ
jgi:hypothetical protein